MGQGGRFCTQQADFKGWRFLWAEKQPNGRAPGQAVGTPGAVDRLVYGSGVGTLQGIQDSRLRIAATVQLLQGA